MLKGLMDRKGFTSYRLAKETGISRQGIDKLAKAGEQELENASYTILKKLSQAMGYEYVEKMLEDAIKAPEVDIHNIEVFRYGPFQIIVQDFQRVFHLEAFQVFPQPVHGKFSHRAPRHIWIDQMTSEGSQSLYPVTTGRLTRPSSACA